jgi:hypothetical protein
MFAGAVLATLGTLVLLTTRRVLPAAILAGAFVALVDTASRFKQRATEIILHAYDVVTLATSPSMIAGLWHDHRASTITVAALLLMAVAGGWVAYRLDPIRIRRRHAAMATAIGIGLVGIGAAARGERVHTEFYFEDIYLSPFLASWSETLETLWRGQLIEAARHAPGMKLTIMPGCGPGTKRPHIILIHQESVVPPSHFPALSYDKRIDPFFHSYDGKLHKLRVETYGGASWLSEFSLFTGLSTHSFGSMRQLVQPMLAGKLHETLPQVLARCGYRNLAFYPMLAHYLGAGRFYQSIGLREIFDARRQGAKLPNERDRFYYASALGEMERHLAASRAPLFVFIETMATHGPYHYAYMPEVDVAGGGAGTDRAMSEYLRRLAMAGMDYGFLREELARRFPGETFLIVHYGDHQPTATLSLLGFRDDAIIEDVLRRGDPRAFLTYYAVDAIGFRPTPLPQVDTLDIPFLSTVILDSAGLPLPDAYRERKRLIQACGGRYHDCPAREEILTLHRRMLDAALIDPR